jgi:hypothetical protein
MSLPLTIKVKVYSSRRAGYITKTFNIKNYEDEEEREEAIEDWEATIKADNENFKNRPTQKIEKNKFPQIQHKPYLDLIIDSNGAQQTTCGLFASGKGGKSTMLIHIWDKVYNNNKFVSTLFSVNAHCKQYKPWKDLRVEEFDAPACKVIKACHQINRNTNNKYWFNFAFDDCVHAKHSRILSELILTMRNANCSSIISLQYIFLLSKSSRGTINNVILGHFNTNESVEAVVKTFLKDWFEQQGLSTMPQMVEAYNYLTKDYGFIYFNPSSKVVTLHRLRL